MKRLFLLMFAGLLAATAAQVPEFHQQYLQRVGGALNEVNRQIEALDARAAKVEMNRYDYIRRLSENPDEIVRREAEHLQSILSRKVRLQRIRDALDGTPAHLMAVRLVMWMNTELVVETAGDFRPAVPATVSGGIHAFAGFLVGYILPFLLRAFLPRRVPVSSERW